MIEIRAIPHADEIEQLTTLYARVFKINTPRQAMAESWRWKYLDHPLSNRLPEAVVAVDGTKIVGARPFMLNELWLGDEKILTAQHCDTMVHPDYRRMGIFNRMGEFSEGYLAEHGCALSYGFPAPMSRKGFASQGYRRIADAEILLRPVNPVAGVYLRIKGEQTDTSTSGYRTEISKTYTGELGVLDSLRNPGVIDMVRTEANLKWRFDACPHQGYRYILAKKAGVLAGYGVISRQRQQGGIMAGVIADFLVKDNDAGCFEALVSRAMQEFARSFCHVAGIWAFSDPGLRQMLMRNRHFRSSLKPIYNSFIPLRYMDVLPIDAGKFSSRDIYDPASWRITSAYANFT